MKLAAPSLRLALSLLIAVGCGARADLDDVLGDAGGSGAAGASSGAGAGSGSGAQGSGGVSTGSQSSGSGAASTGSGAASTGSQSTGVGGSSSTATGGSGTGGVGGETCPSFDTNCGECLSEACPDIWCNCFENSECFALFDCFGECNGGEACQQQCLAAHEEGIADVLLVSDCAATTCDGACPWGNDVPPCGECIYEDCEDEVNACFAQPSCLLLFDCLTGCGPVGLTCQEQCYQDFGAGTALLQAVLECSVDECDSACP
jgi:hypothetical protein